MKRGAIDFFNASRWVAAFVVVFYHARGILFPPLSPTAGFAAKSFFALTSFGHEAVIVFFVLSGFLVGGLSVVKVQSGRFRMGEYINHRFCRIYTVLLPALIFTAVVDMAGLACFGDSGILISPPLRILPDSHSTQTFFGNLFMLYGISAPRFGSNGAIWSLVNEWWYYCLFGAGLAVVTMRRIWAKAIAILLVVLVLSYLPSQILALGLVWVLGVGACIYGRSTRWTPPILVSAILFVGSLCASRVVQRGIEVDVFSFSWRSFFFDVLIGVSFALLAASFSSRGSRPLPLSAVHKRLADFSFSLYLTHIPVIILVIAASQSLLGMRNKAPLDLSTCIIFGVSCLIPILVAYVFFLFFEKHTDFVRRFLEAKLFRSTADVRI